MLKYFYLITTIQIMITQLAVSSLPSQLTLSKLNSRLQKFNYFNTSYSKIVSIISYLDALILLLSKGAPEQTYLRFYCI